MNESPAVFRFSLGRMLLLTAVVGVWFAGLKILPAAWALWLTTAVFYAGVLLCFSSAPGPRGD